MQYSQDDDEFLLAAELSARFQAARIGAKTSTKAQSIIKEGWRVLLKKVFPRIFSGSFASFHEEFFDHYWEILQKRLRGERLSQDEKVFLAIWARGFGKSSCMEVAAILEGAIVGEGFVLYVSGTKDLAQAHLQSIKEALESEEVEEYFPGLANPQIGKFGSQLGWSQDILVTASGWAIRPIGLDQAVRGLRRGTLRPTLIILDDIDDVDDSPLVIEKKIRKIARSIIPARGPNTAFLGAQNLIHRNSIFTQIWKRRIGLFSRRVISGPFPAFNDLQIKFRVTNDGPQYVIESCTPSWPDFDLQSAQEFLSDSGREHFMAEYQHDFALDQSGRVVSQYAEELHVITWEQFTKRFGTRRIPDHWFRYIGHDWGSTGLEKHPAVVSHIAVSGENSKLPGKLFLFKGRTYEADCLPQEVGADICRDIWPPWEKGKLPQERRTKYVKWLMSHEALSERGVYRKLYGLPFKPGNSSKKAGWAELNHYLTPDKSQPHPFHEDEWLEDAGEYKLGCPSFFLIVEAEQQFEAVDDKGLARWRDEFLNLEYRSLQLGETGLTKEEPFKFRDDACDSVRFVTYSLGFKIAKLTKDEKVMAKVPKSLHPDEKDTPEQRDAKEVAFFVARQRATEIVNQESSTRRDEHLVDEPETEAGDSVLFDE